MQVDLTLLADGGSDRALLRITQWVFEQHVPAAVPVRGEVADLSPLRDPPKTLKHRICRAVELYPCNVLLVHRDAETQNPDKRYEEINTAYRDAQIGTACSHVCVVPVRMTEAWLLFNESAIRKAAGNPNGTISLNLPEVPDNEPNPKQVLLEALRDASGLKGRRRKLFRPEAARFTLANLIDDFAPLRRLIAFRRFEHDVQEVLHQMRSSEVPGGRSSPNLGI